MKIAISTDGDNVSQHFGRCPEFTLVEVDNGELKGKEVIPNPGHHPGFLPQFLRSKGVQRIVAGGMGARAQQLFAEHGIDTVLGISGSVDKVIEQVLDRTLKAGESSCLPGQGKGYGVEKTECDHEGEE
ncbi:MAG: NifB/NifX family molybdenum-iron cluster-binding protein [Candidatus Margulisiibacteriota bacterium]|nr:NifB/NifX family molybdenum-iron cluster-binding protein [Candidatus Margulisiibacteriota bacterium]